MKLSMTDATNGIEVTLTFRSLRPVVPSSAIAPGARAIGSMCEDEAREAIRSAVAPLLPQIVAEAAARIESALVESELLRHAADRPSLIPPGNE